MSPTLIAAKRKAKLVSPLGALDSAAIGSVIPSSIVYANFGFGLPSH